MNLRYLRAYLKRYPLMASVTLGQISAYPAIWLAVICEWEGVEA